MNWAKAWAQIKTLLQILFGKMQYQLPNWLIKVNAKALQVWNINPKRSKQILGGLIAVAALSWGGWKYYQSLPKPDYVTMEVFAPQPANQDPRYYYTLRIMFSKSTAKASDLNKKFTEGITLKPAMSGEWHWQSDRTLVFTPDPNKPDWAVGETYEVSFAKNFFPSHLIFESRELEFKTEDLKSQVSKEEFYIDPSNPEIKKVLVNIKFNYPIEVEDLKKKISFELQNKGIVKTSKAVPFTINTNAFQTEIFLQSESLPLPVDSQTMLVKLEKGVRAQAGGPASESYENVEVKIPNRYEGLSISGVNTDFVRNEKFEPEQILVVTTTSSARTEDVAKLLKLHLLPALKGKNWTSVAEVDAETLDKSPEIPFTVIPSEKEWSEVHTFKFQTEVERSLYVRLEKGLVGLGGYEINTNYDNVLWLSNYPQELSIMSKGSILTLSGDLKLPLLARNVAKVEVSLSRVLPDQVNHLIYQMSDSMTKPYLYDLVDKISEKFETTLPLVLKSAKATQYFSFDMQPYLNKSSSMKGVFLFKATAKDRNGQEGVSDYRLIMVTDLGLLVKETVAKSHEVFVQNLRTGNPVAGAAVEVVGANGLKILAATTNEQGRVSFPDLSDFKNEKRPLAFVVRKDQDQAFLPFRVYQQNLSYSRFDIGGLYENNSSDQLMSMVFSDRGIYRPGEEVNLGVILRSKKGGSSAQKPPLEWVVTDPQGAELLREKFSVANADLKSLRFATTETSPTGTYSIRVYIIKKELPNRELELIGSQTVKIEEFQPDRLKIQVDLDPVKLKGWIKPQEVKALVSLKNLFGTAAENRDIRGEMTLSPSLPVFRDYKEYAFTNLNKNDEQIYSETLSTETTDGNGQATLKLDLTKYAAALFSLRLDVEGFEAEGGRSVRAQSSVLVSPLDFVLGSKADGDLNYLKKDSARNLHIIALNSDLAMTAADSVTVQTLERKYVSVLTKDYDGTMKYQSVFKEIPIEEKAFAVGAKGSTFKVDTSKAGDYTLAFKLAGKTELLRVNYSVVGEANLTRSMEKNAELQLALNKSDFKNGEEIEMQIKAPYKGAGLITIERDGVYATKWFKTSTTSTVESIRVPEGLDGNAYVNVTFLRAIDSNEVYASPLSYAVAPFSVSLDEHRTQIKLELPALVKPGQKLKIQYSANKKTDIILYGVDEGILQVAKYKLPDPLGFFFQKRALQVRTHQMLDLLLPEFSILEQLQATGGDDGFGALGKNLNPFKSRRQKPVVFWSEVITADTSAKTYTYEVPDTFNGNLKVMAVAASSKGLGATQSESLVRGDLIVSPNVPVFVSPTDEFKVSVSVSNQKENSGAQAKVKLETKASSHFELLEGAEQELSIAEGHEVSSDVKVKTKDQLGVGDLTFQATLGDSSARTKWEVSIRPATPYLHFLQAGLIGDSAVDLKNTRKLYPEFAEAQVAASGTPLVMTAGLLAYLDTYPYQCTEQLISRAVPAMMVRSRAEFLPDVKKAQDQFKNVLQILRQRQHSDGGFALYNPLYESESSPAVSLYVIQYLIEAKARSMSVPEDLLTRAKNFLQSNGLRNSANSLQQARRWAYSLYLSARMGVVDGASLAQLRRSAEENLKGKWELDTAAIFMAATYSLYKQDEAATKIISKLELGQSKEVDIYDYMEPAVRDSILIEILARHFPTRLNQVVTNDRLMKLMLPFNQGQYQTHNIGRLLLALDALASAPSAQAALANLKLTMGNQVQEAIKAQPKTWKLDPNVTALQLSGGNTPLFYSFYVNGFDKTSAPVKKGIEVSRQYVNGEGKEVSQVKIGDEIGVRLQVRTLDEKAYQHLVLVDLLPAGFEVVRENLNTAVETNSYQEGGGEEGYEGGEGGEGEYEEGEGGEVESEESGFLWDLILPKAYAQQTNLSPLLTQFVDQREDRMVIYYSADKDLREFSYKIKAVTSGKFVAPPVFTEGMYNREIQFLGSPATIEVVK